MKKLIALILALLLLSSTVACAESSSVFELKDPLVDVTTGGQTIRLDLKGLTLRFGLLGEEHKACLILNLLGGDELLFTGAARLDGQRLLLTADGLSHSYALDMPSAALSDGSGQEQGSSGLSADLLEKIMAEAEIGMEGGAITFRLPYTAVNKLLRELLPTLDKIPNAAELIGQLDEMEAQGQGIELAGSVNTSAGLSAVLGAYPVQGGVASQDPLFVADFDLTPVGMGADFTLALSVPSQGADPVFRLEGSYRAADPGMELHLKLFVPSVSPAEPVGTVDLSVGEDFSLRLEAAGVFRFEAGYTRAAHELLLSAEAASFRGSLRATTATGEAELSGCDFPAEVIELTAMTDAEKDALSLELQAALTPVIEFMMPALSEAGLLG